MTKESTPMITPKQNACRYCGGFGTVPFRKLYQAETKQVPCPHCQPGQHDTGTGMDAIITQVAQLIVDERERQIKVEGFTAEHDAEHKDGELARAGECYLNRALAHARQDDACPASWPWEQHWWKPGTVERDLVRAAALFAAEKEQLQSLPGSRDRWQRWFKVEIQFGEASRALGLILRDRAERASAMVSPKLPDSPHQSTNADEEIRYYRDGLAKLSNYEAMQDSPDLRLVRDYAKALLLHSAETVSGGEG